MAKKRKPMEPSLFEVSTKTAPCVPAIREAVRAWREDKYKGSTETSKALLNYWFLTDHRLRDGSAFKYYYFQREAIETLVFLYEIAGACRHKDLIEKYATGVTDAGFKLPLLQYDFFPRYCIKMATGSGKTKVISLAIAWQYFNAVLEDAEQYAKSALIIAPNVILDDQVFYS